MSPDLDQFHGVFFEEAEELVETVERELLLGKESEPTCSPRKWSESLRLFLVTVKQAE